MQNNIYDIVRKHFPEKEYALMREVRNAAGYGATRSADYIAMNLWPSRGLALHGIEQKSYRSDWIKELKTPEKADSIFKYCDFWWLLTTEENVAKIDEIPETWGWLHIEKGRVKVKKQAPKLSPSAVDRGFLACLLRRAVCKEGYILRSSIKDEINQAKQQAENEMNYKFKQLSERYTELSRQVNEFRNYTGINIGNTDSWRLPDMEKIGTAVNLIASGGIEKFVKDMERIEVSAKRLLETVSNEIQTLKTTTEKC